MGFGGHATPPERIKQKFDEKKSEGGNPYFQFAPATPLEPGEYLLTRGSANYLFGVDATIQ